jgi:endonuclease-3
MKGRKVISTNLYLTMVGVKDIGSLFEKMEERYNPLWPWPEESDFNEDPFKNLVMTVLSQNTSSENSGRAYKNLSTKFKITPNALVRADEREIRKAIRPGGLQRVKAKKLKTISKFVLERFGGSLNEVLRRPKDEARAVLLQIPGVGDKTADVLLSQFYGRGNIIPIDTHMNRIAKRLGLVPSAAGYKEVQDALLKFIPKGRGARNSGLLWLLAKHTCKAQRPRCSECVLSGICKRSI